MSYKSTSKHVLVMEPHAGGHHGYYLQWMVEGFAECGIKVTIVTLPESLQHQSLQYISNHFSNIVNIISAEGGRRIRKDPGNGGIGLMQREQAYWWMFRAWYLQQNKKFQPDVVFLPYMDYCLYSMGLIGSPFGSTPWFGVVMRPSFHYHEMEIVAPQPAFRFLKKKVFLRLLRSRYLKCLLTADEPLIKYLERLDVNPEKIKFLPEPYDLGICFSPREAKIKLGVDVVRKVILVYGAITSRKGVVELLRAIANPACPQFVDVLIAGKVAGDVRALLSERWVKKLLCEKRVVVFDRFIMPEEETVLFLAVDIVWLGYIGHYTSSGVLVQAAKAGRPIVSCEDGVLGWQTKRHNLGVVVHPTDIDSVVAGIRRLVENESLCVIYGNNGQQAFKKNTIDIAKGVITAIVEC